MKRPKARFRKLENVLARQRGMRMLAESQLQLLCASSLYSREFASCSLEAKADRVARTLFMLRGSIAKFRSAGDVAAIDYALDAFKFRAAGQLHPLFAHRQTDQRRAEQTLKGQIPPKQSSHFVKAWSLASLQLLRERGMTETDAVRAVARALDRKTNTVREWQRELGADSARFLNEPGASHLQRLSFRARLCYSYACEHKLSGRQMLKLIKTDPLLVYRLSLRANRSPIADPEAQGEPCSRATERSMLDSPRSSMTSTR